MSYHRLLRTLIITLTASVTLPLLGADPNAVAESREAARAARAAQTTVAQSTEPAPTQSSAAAPATADRQAQSLNPMAVQNGLSAAGNTQVIRVAAAASAPGTFVGLGLAPQERPTFGAEPPGFVLFVAGLLAILFISTRRRKDR